MVIIGLKLQLVCWGEGKLSKCFLFVVFASAVYVIVWQFETRGRVSNTPVMSSICYSETQQCDSVFVCTGQCHRIKYWDLVPQNTRTRALLILGISSLARKSSKSEIWIISLFTYKIRILFKYFWQYMMSYEDDPYPFNLSVSYLINLKIT